MIRLPVIWEVSGFVQVEADTIEDAIDHFYENSDHIPLPGDSDYICGSFGLASDDPECIKLYQE